MLIVYAANGTGWEPVTYMVTLAAELFEAELLIIDTKMPDRWRQLEYLFFGRQRHIGNEPCLLICPNPTFLLSLSLIPNWRKRFSWVAAWIIDSYWVDWTPKILQTSRVFDHLFVTTQEDVAEWQRIMKTPTTWLPWGSDVLRLGGAEPNRIWDLTRVGRQPPEWEDDLLTEQACLSRNLRFHGRPQFFANAQENQTKLMELYRQTKFLLAFSNAVNPMKYTHPSRQYLTARWVDALACGAVVAGVPPESPDVDRLLWPGATLDLESVRREEGLQAIADATQNWHPEQAQKNYQQALTQLDWRWRFAILADVLKVPSQRLQQELQLLNQKVEGCRLSSRF